MAKTIDKPIPQLRDEHGRAWIPKPAEHSAKPASVEPKAAKPDPVYDLVKELVSQRESMIKMMKAMAATLDVVTAQRAPPRKLVRATTRHLRDANGFIIQSTTTEEFI